MGYASISGKARTNPTNPKAFGVCDRCGQWRNHVDLRWQMDYRGRQLSNLRILVCEVCEDQAQPQLKPRIIPPDPLPIPNARTEPYIYDETNNRYTSAPPAVDFFTGIPISTGDNRVTQDHNNRVTQQTGTAPGSRSVFPGVEYNVPSDLGLPYDYEGAPNTGFIVEETYYVFWLGGTTGPMWWRNDLDFNMYWTNGLGLGTNYIKWLNDSRVQSQWMNNGGFLLQWT